MNLRQSLSIDGARHSTRRAPTCRGRPRRRSHGHPDRCDARAVTQVKRPLGCITGLSDLSCLDDRERRVGRGTRSSFSPASSLPYSVLDCPDARSWLASLGSIARPRGPARGSVSRADGSMYSSDLATRTRSSIGMLILKKILTSRGSGIKMGRAGSDSIPRNRCSISIAALTI